MMSAGRVTIAAVIATLGRPDALRSALRSLAESDPGPDAVLVVDGSPDVQAASVVAECAPLLPCPVRHVASAPGLTRQRNVGLAAATTDVVLFLDDDARVEPDALGHLAAAYTEPEVVGATGIVDEPASNRVGGKQSPLRRLLFGRRREGSFTRFGYPRRLVQEDRDCDVEFMQGCFMSARTAVAREVGFDEALPGYALAEDEDFSYRLARRGRVRHVPAAVVHHDNAGFGGRDRRAFNRTVVVHRAYLFRKNFPQTPLSRLQFAALIVVLMVHRLLNRDLDGLRGLLTGVRDVARGARPGS